MRMGSIIVTGIAAVSAAFMAQSALAGAHTWQLVEAFSTADGTVQFIELRECCGGPGEIFVGGAPVSSGSHTFIFPANLVGNTANRHILLGTAAYAALPGAPAPDHIIPANFFNPNGDTLSYSVYDTWFFKAGEMPTDCVLSLLHAGGTAVNSPTNYVTNQPGSVNACPVCVGDTNNTGTVDIDDLVTVITNWGAVGRNPGDVTNNNVVNIDDLVAVITNWGPCD